MGGPPSNTPVDDPPEVSPPEEDPLDPPDVEMEPELEPVESNREPLTTSVQQPESAMRTAKRMQ